MDPITLKLVAEPLVRQAPAEDITSEDVSTASVMPGAHRATVQLIAKADGVICGLDVFERTFQLRDINAYFIMQTIKPNSTIKKHKAQNWFYLLEPILLKVATKNDPHGIVRC